MESDKSGGIKFVLFDLDGTLIDSASWLLASVNRVLAPYVAAPWKHEDLIRTAGGPEHQVFAAVVPAPELEGVLAAYREALSSGEGFRVQAGIEGLLADLANAGCTLGIFSGAGRVLGELRLRHAGWSERFPVCVWGDETAAKPAPDGILLALRRAGVVPGDAVYVGDTEKDRDAARAAGVRFLGVTWGDRPAGPGGCELVRAPSELKMRLLER